MSCTASGATARPYGVKLVCHTWEQPRSSYYAHRQVSGLPVKLTHPGKRGPKTALSDAELLELIRADLKASPFKGEGHRKVGARLRVRDAIKVGRRRVLRLMRENNLLSPYRGRRGHPTLHQRAYTKLSLALSQCHSVGHEEDLPRMHDGCALG